MATVKACDRCGAAINPPNSGLYVIYGTGGYRTGGGAIMAEYIEIGAARKHLCSFCIGEEICDRGGNCNAMKSFEAIPAADVAPVRHGRWIKDSDGLTICSECEEVALQRVFIKLPEKIVDLQMRKSHYCPNCGARMEEGNR